jgi:hypothetical protein
MYSSPEVDPATEPTDGTVAAGLSAATPLAPAVPGGAGVAASGVAVVEATFESPAETEIKVPFTIGIVLAVSVAFTIFAGVSSPIVDLARHATLIF